MELDPLTVLNKRYTIKRALGSPGPFDITYLGEAVDSDDQYIVREFFPVHLARRKDGETAVTVDGDDENTDLFESGLEYFRKESAVLAELDHEALPASYDHFEANGTYYRVRPHPPSMSLARGLKDRGALSEQAALTIMIPVLRALHTAHDNGLYHGGVSPSTIRVLEDGKVLLTGFRGAFFQLARETGHLSDLVQSGTSAVEQYTPRGQQGPWTDVYAAAATVCQMVTGESLPESTDRLEGDDSLTDLVQDADAFSSPGVREALLDALTVDPSKRLQSVEALTDALTESSVSYDEDEASYSIVPVEPDVGEEEADEDEVEVLSTRAEDDRPAQPSGTAETKKEEGTGRAALMIGIPVLVLALGGGAWFMMTTGSAASSGGGQYADYRQTADSLFENENYDEAEFYYNQALQARDGEDQYVEQRLQKLSEVQQQGAQQQYRSAVSRGTRLMSTADSLYNANSLGEASQQYSRALAAFYSALDANPQGTEAQEMIDRVQKQQEAIAKEQAGGGGDEGVNLDQIANFFRKQGDRQLQAGNLQAALNKYQQALEYKPDNQELQSAVEDLRAQIEQRQQEEQFQEYYNRGQQLIRENKYQAAQAAFDRAAQIQPNDAQLEQAIARTDSLLRVQRQQRQRYERYRARGDSAYDAESFEEAITAYKQALDVRPEDQYVLERIEAAQRELKQMKLAQQELEEQEKRREEIVDDQGVYTTVDQQPKVRGGLSALTERAEYPEEARDGGVEGRVYVQAVVNADGTVRSAEVVRGLGAGCDEEALEVVRQAEFVPAKYNGEAVTARTTVFIQFELAN